MISDFATMMLGIAGGFAYICIVVSVLVYSLEFNRPVIGVAAVVMSFAPLCFVAYSSVGPVFP